MLVFLIKPGIDLDVSPIFSTVSIMPGIDCLAPDLTDKSNGLSESPNFVPIIDSTSDNDFFTSEAKLSGNDLLFL